MSQRKPNSECVEFKVDIDNYYNDFIKTSSLSPSDAFKELQHNIKPLNNNEKVKSDFKFLDENFDQVKTKKNNSKNILEISKYKYIVIEDNSDKPMTMENGKNTMNSLAILIKVIL